MDDGDRELANRLFAFATAMLEDAAVLATAGQSPRLTALQLADHGLWLQAAARDIAVLAEAAAIAAEPDVNQGRNRRKRRH